MGSTATERGMTSSPVTLDVEEKRSEEKCGERDGELDKTG